MSAPPVIQSACPLWEDLRADHSAQTYRQWLKDEWPAQGLIRTADGACTAGSGLSINYTAFSAIVHASDASDGAYYIPVAAGNVTLTAADGSNPRIDLVVLSVRSGDSDAVIDVVTGTPAASPVAPAVPSQSIPLCEVRVNAAATSPTSITDRKYRACKRGLTLLEYGSTTQFINVTNAKTLVTGTFVVPPGRTCLQVEFDAHLRAIGSNTVQDIGFFAEWKINGSATGLSGATWNRIFAANSLSGVNNWLDNIVARQWYPAMAAGTYTYTLGLGMSTTASPYDVFAGRFNIRIEY